MNAWASARQGLTVCDPTISPAEPEPEDGPPATVCSRSNFVRSGQAHALRLIHPDDDDVQNAQIGDLAPTCIDFMIKSPTDFARARGAWAKAILLAAALLSLPACGPFDPVSVAETCVAASMKHGEPFGNDGERAESEAQFRQYCAAAARRQR